MLDVVRATSGGVKIFDVVPQSTSNFSQGIINSSDDGKIVVTTYGQGFQFPHAYRYWGSGNSFGTYGLYSGGGIFQNGSGIPGSCQYSPFTPANIAGCFVVPPNEWLTWTMCIKLGALGIFTDGVGATAQSWLNSEVQLYVQRNGQSRIQLLDWNPNTPDYRPLLASHDYGQMTLFPYTTTPTDGSQVEGNVYYDELIFSDNDPGEATPAVVGGAATRVDRSRVSIG
jgi:hypothetical protein